MLGLGIGLGLGLEDALGKAVFPSVAPPTTLFKI